MAFFRILPNFLGYNRTNEVVTENFLGENYRKLGFLQNDILFVDPLPSFFLIPKINVLLVRNHILID